MTEPTTATFPLDVPLPAPETAWSEDLKHRKEVVEYNASLLDLEKKLRDRAEEIDADEHERLKRGLELRDKQLQVEERDFVWTTSRDRFNHSAGRFVLYDTVDDYSVKALIQEILQWNSVAPAGDPVKLIINSPGGSVIDGLALYDTLRFVSEESGRQVTTVALGYAASMGGVLLQAGDVRLITASSSMLIHEISSGSRGSTGRLKDHMEHIEMLTNRLVTILASKSTLTEDELRDRWDRKDWWLTAQDVVDYGFADRIGNV
jgi:ATP-dependent Clp protease, protease subunit